VAVRAAFLRLVVDNALGRKPWNRFRPRRREMQAGGSSRTSERAINREMWAGELSETAPARFRARNRERSGRV